MLSSAVVFDRMRKVAKRRRFNDTMVRCTPRMVAISLLESVGGHEAVELFRGNYAQLGGGRVAAKYRIEKAMGDAVAAIGKTEAGRVAQASFALVVEAIRVSQEVVTLLEMDSVSGGQSWGFYAAEAVSDPLVVLRSAKSEEPWASARVATHDVPFSRAEAQLLAKRLDLDALALWVDGVTPGAAREAAERSMLRLGGAIDELLEG